MISNKELKSCLVEFVKVLSDKDFLKTAGKRLHGEREILVALKIFLRGRYKNMQPEQSISLGREDQGVSTFVSLVFPSKWRCNRRPSTAIGYIEDKTSRK